MFLADPAARFAVKPDDYYPGGGCVGTGRPDYHNNWFKGKKVLRERVVQAAERLARAAEKEAQAAEKADGAGNMTIRIQWITVWVTVAVALATAWAAYEAGSAVKSSQNIASQQAKDSRAIASQQDAESKFTMAVTSISSKDPLQQVAGFMLLHSSVRSQVNAAVSDPAWRADAYDAYVTSIDVLHVYLHGATIVGRNPPLSALVAGGTLGGILEMGPKVGLFGVGPPPSIDLSNTALPGVHWAFIRIDRLAHAFMPGIDLRGASLEGSFWGHADLEHAHLQCADLRDADLRWVDLRGADLRGANLSGTVLPPAALRQGANMNGAVGPVQGLRIAHLATSYQLANCRTERFYAD